MSTRKPSTPIVGVSAARGDATPQRASVPAAGGVRARSTRLAVLMALCAVGCALIIAPASAVAHRTDNPTPAPSAAYAAATVHFFAIINEPSAPLPLVQQPHSLYVFPHGTWNLANLRWTGWGTSAAHATGESLMDNCEPNCLAGKWSRASASLTLSHPGLYLGRDVYRCIHLIFANHTAIARNAEDFCYR